MFCRALLSFVVGEKCPYKRILFFRLRFSHIYDFFINLLIVYTIVRFLMELPHRYCQTRPSIRISFAPSLPTQVQLPFRCC